MNERPILFNSEMVRAILDGRKSQTRRVIKPQPYSDVGALGVKYGGITTHNFHLFSTMHGGGTSDSGMRLCPYGVPGDRLWVRETFCIESSYEVGPYKPPFRDGRPCRWHDNEEWWEQPHYKATDPTPELEIGTGDPGVKWTPSIHMPRWASRITLEIVNVRVERVQEIDEAGAILEGADASKYEKSYRYAFSQLWDSINAKRGFGWDANPWLWIIEFKRVIA